MMIMSQTLCRLTWNSQVLQTGCTMQQSLTPLRGVQTSVGVAPSEAHVAGDWCTGDLLMCRRSHQHISNKKGLKAQRQHISKLTTQVGE